MSTETPFFELIEDVIKLTLITAFLYFALQAYVKRHSTGWTKRFTRRRIAVLGVIGLVVLVIKVFEDVLGKESGPIDETILRFIHEHVPAVLSPFFSIITLTGSFRVLFPATVAVTIALVLFRRTLEALLVAVSMVSAGTLVYIIKIAVERARPALWESKDYWGTSFPSGHTLGTAAFATAVSIAVIRIWPRSRNLVTVVAFAWVLLVGLSRLVLGVHWPTDVLAAICLGTLVPLGLSLTWFERDVRDSGLSSRR